jgi:hypothetical protein
MAIEIPLIGLAVHLLFWDKLPNWGTWFRTLIAGLPRPFRRLYDQWRCSYCAGFWIALALHGLTGQWTLQALAEMPVYVGRMGMPIAWFLDALAAATLIFIASKALAAISRTAVKVRIIEDAPVQSGAENKLAA